MKIKEAYKKSTKVDYEIDTLEQWINLKDGEIPDDEGIIVNEEQFDKLVVKYKVL